MHPAYLLLAGTAGDAPATHLACALRELLRLNLDEFSCLTSALILTIDSPAFITNRRDTSVKLSNAYVGARFQRFPVQGVNNRGAFFSFSHGCTAKACGGHRQHFRRDLAQSAPDCVKPIQVFGLHEHGAEAGDAALLVLVCPRTGRKKRAG